VESGIWDMASGRVCGKHFLCRNAAIGTEVERLKGKPEGKRKGSKKGLHPERKGTGGVSK